MPQATPAAAILPPTLATTAPASDPPARPSAPGQPSAPTLLAAVAPSAVASPVAPAVEPPPAREPTQPEFPVPARSPRRRRPDALHRVATVRGWPSDPALMTSTVKVIDGVAKPLGAPSSPTLSSPVAAPVAPPPARKAAPEPRLETSAPKPRLELVPSSPSLPSLRPVAPLPPATRSVQPGLLVAAALVTGVCAYGLMQHLMTLMAG